MCEILLLFNTISLHYYRNAFQCVMVLKLEIIFVKVFVSFGILRHANDGISFGENLGIDQSWPKLFYFVWKLVYFKNLSEVLGCEALVKDY